MFCSKCGKTNDDEARFCQYCGFTLRPEPSHGSPSTALVIPETPLNYAGFWNRFAAALIDSLILAIGGFIFTIPSLIGGRIARSPSWVIVDSIIYTLIWWLYYTLLESSLKQATIGKMAVGLIVTDLSGNQISFGRANGRYWGKIISVIMLGIGYMMAGFTKKKQALHDIMADTLVLKKSHKVNEWVTALVIVVWIVSTLGTTAAITIPLYEKYRDAKTKEQNEKKLQTQTIKGKMNEVTIAVSNVASAVVAYHEDLNSWPLFDHADAIAIQTSLGVSIPGDIIRSITISSSKPEQVTITTIIRNIDSTVDGKNLILAGKLMEQGATETSRKTLWFWDRASTVPVFYLPK